MYTSLHALSVEPGSQQVHMSMRGCSRKEQVNITVFVTGADTATQLGKRKRANGQPHQVPSMQTQPAIAAIEPPARQPGSISLQPQSGSQMLPFSAASPPQPDDGNSDLVAIRAHHQNAAEKVLSRLQLSSHLPRVPGTSSAQDALPSRSQLISHPLRDPVTSLPQDALLPAAYHGSQAVPDPDTGQSRDAGAVEPTGPQQGIFAPAMPDQGDSSRDRFEVKPAGPKTASRIQHLEQPSSKNSMPLQEAASKIASTSLSVRQKSADSHSKNATQQKPASSKSTEQKAEPGRSTSPGSASQTSTSGSGSPSGSGTSSDSGSPDRSGSTSDSRSASNSDSGSGSGPATPRRHRGSTSDTSLRSARHPHRSAQQTTRRSQASGGASRSRHDRSPPRRLTAVSARTDLKRRSGLVHAQELPQLFSPEFSHFNAKVLAVEQCGRLKH